MKYGVQECAECKTARHKARRTASWSVRGAKISAALEVLIEARLEGHFHSLLSLQSGTVSLSGVYPSAFGQCLIAVTHNAPHWSAVSPYLAAVVSVTEF